MPEHDGDAPSPGPPGPVVLSVCVNCLGPDGTERPGERLFTSLREQPEAGIVVRPVQCLSVCKRPCTVALTGASRYTYLFGDLDPATAAAALIEGARIYRSQEHGYMLWRERPEPLRRSILARIPPLGWDAEDGRHPR